MYKSAAPGCLEFSSPVTASERKAAENTAEDNSEEEDDWEEENPEEEDDWEEENSEEEDNGEEDYSEEENNREEDHSEEEVYSEMAYDSGDEGISKNEEGRRDQASMDLNSTLTRNEKLPMQRSF